tara:strand:- start:381 stop:860 length:480 start_codon:yes stop_codon:yes gene_type:complete
MKQVHNIFSKSIQKEKAEKCPNLKIKIIVDTREKQSLVPTNLESKKANWEFQTLTEGDYEVGHHRIERKTINDFASSFISGRLETQLENLKKLHQNPVLLFENSDSPLKTKLHKNVIKANLLKITLELNIPVIYTDSEEDTANQLILLARRIEKHGIKN